MAKQKPNLDDRIFAAIMGAFTGLAVAKVAAPQHTLKIAGGGALVGSLLLPKLFPVAYGLPKNTPA